MNALQPQPPTPGPERYVYAGVTLLRTVDGDTAYFRFPLPFCLHIDLDMRLLGINAPERTGVSAAAGAAATAYLTGLLTGAESLTVQTYKTDKYGRWLAEIWALKAGAWLNINADMIASGHAVSYWP